MSKFSQGLIFLKGYFIEFLYRRETEKELNHSITNGHLLFVMGALILQRAQKCKVRQVTRDVVKSEV